MSDQARLAPATPRTALGRRRGGLDPLTLSALLAAVLVLLAQRAFWSVVFTAGPTGTLQSAGFALAVAIAVYGLTWLPLLLLAWPRSARVGWSLWLLLAAVAAYFMDSYGLVIDRVAIQSVLETDPHEVSEWISPRMLPFLLAAALSIALVFWLPLNWPSRTAHARRLLLGCVAAMSMLLGGIAAAYQPLASLARNHRELGHLIAPWNVVEGLVSYIRVSVDPRPRHAVAVGSDARLGPSWQPTQPPRLLVLVIGESARASSFSLLGYPRDTNPELARQDVLAFGNIEACGTSTAVSLPCMLSDLGREHFSDRKARGRESILDVISHAGLAAAWIDNNTGSKSAAKRIEEISIAAATDPNWCSPAGCQDGLLVEQLDARLDRALASGVLVLHQKGSHGPSYFERYPPNFRQFQPTCESNDLSGCSREQILNTYDNTILYTDHVLASIIERLQARAGQLDSSLLYISDHGESTGENGIYLHGAPRFMAPDEQLRVPMLLWASPGFAAHRGLDLACLRDNTDLAMSHDHLFHSLLGLLDLQTTAYQRDLDLFAGCVAPPGDPGAQAALGHGEREHPLATAN